jgi:pilus assembly protein CpaE
MNSPTSRILVVDDNERTRDELIELLRFPDMDVVGESTFGAAAYTWAEQLNVDVVLVTIEEPVARSLRTVESLTVGPRSWPVIGISSHGDRETMRKAMVSGVRDFLVRPLNAEELHATIVNIHRVDQARRAVVLTGESSRPLGTIITIAGFKGGIGKSTVASNIAVSLARQTQQHVVLMDLDLQFGDAAVMLDLVPTHTSEDLLNDIGSVDAQLVHGYFTTHASRCKVLAAPTAPDAAEQFNEENVGQMLELIASTSDFVVVDTSPQLDDISATAMDLSTIVLVVVTPEVPCIRRTKAALTLMRNWGYSKDKVKLVVNRSQRGGEVSLAEIEQVLDYPVYAQIPEDRMVAKSISMGTPVAMFDPKGRAGSAANDLTRALTGMPKPQRGGIIRRRAKAQPQVPPRWAPAASNTDPQDQSWLYGARPPLQERRPAAPQSASWDFQWPATSDGHPAAAPVRDAGRPVSRGQYEADVLEDVVVTGSESLGLWATPRVREE